MNIGRREFLKTSLMGLAGLTALILTEKIHLSKQKISNLALVVSQESANRKVRETFTEKQSESEKTASNYELIRDNIYDFLKDYIEKVSKDSSQFRINVKKYGLEGFTEIYQEAHIDCLDLAKKAIERVKENNKDIEEITEQEYRELGKKLCERQKQYSSPHINYSDEKVIDAQTKWAEVRVQHFLRLLKTNPCKDFKELVNSAYDRQEYEKYIERQNKASRKLYSSMRKTMNFLEIYGTIEYNISKKGGTMYLTT